MFSSDLRFSNRHGVFKKNYQLSIVYVMREIKITTKLIKITTKLIKLKLYTWGIFIDLQKAFDTVDHTIPLKKYHYGVRSIVNDWFTCYLTEITEIGPLNRSKKATVLSRVPQGSVLGPLLVCLTTALYNICNS